VAKQYLEIAKRNKSKLCVISLDLDKFKNINDTYGHQAGDKVLIEFATTVNLFMRKSDIFARIGGEEFVVLIQNTDMKNTMIVCEKIRKEVEHSSVEYKDNIINFSVSIGVAEFTKENSIDELLEKSDTALYKAKESGRNQVLEYK
jgi:diguanylate cyclase (GGDEF)-like protein